MDSEKLNANIDTQDSKEAPDQGCQINSSQSIDKASCLRMHARFCLIKEMGYISYSTAVGYALLEAYASGLIRTEQLHWVRLQAPLMRSTGYSMCPRLYRPSTKCLGEDWWLVLGNAGEYSNPYIGGSRRLNITWDCRTIVEVCWSNFFCTSLGIYKPPRRGWGVFSWLQRI